MRRTKLTIITICTFLGALIGTFIAYIIFGDIQSVLSFDVRSLKMKFHYPTGHMVYLIIFMIIGGILGSKLSSISFHNNSKHFT